MDGTDEVLIELKVKNNVISLEILIIDYFSN